MRLRVHTPTTGRPRNRHKTLLWLSKILSVTKKKISDYAAEIDRVAKKK